MSSHLYGGTLGGSLMPRRSFLGFRVTSMLMMAALLPAVASIPSAPAAAGVDSFDVSMWEYDDTGSLSRPPGARSPTLARTELPSMHCPGASFAPSLNSLVPGGTANPVLGKPRVGSALKSDPHHAFPDLVDNFATDAQRFTIPTRGPGGQVVRQSELLQVEGSLSGRQGVFEWIVDQGQITHRRFIPGGRVTGSPNQIPGAN